MSRDYAANRSESRVTRPHLNAARPLSVAPQRASRAINVYDYHLCAAPRRDETARPLFFCVLLRRDSRRSIRMIKTTARRARGIFIAIIIIGLRSVTRRGDGKSVRAIALREI